MKLKSLNCKNCGSPLREENGQLHCSVCGSTFPIEVSVEARKIEQMQRSLEESEASIEADKRALEEFHRAKEEAQMESERKKEQQREAFRREVRKKANYAMIRGLVFTMVISFAIIGGVLFLASRLGSSKKAKATTTTTEGKNYRITPSNLKSAGTFLPDLTEKVIEMEKENHSGSVYESTDDTLFIWNLSGDPYIEEYYLLTRDDRNWLYMLVALPMEGFDNGGSGFENREKLGYEMVCIEDVLIGTDGTVTYYEDRISTDGSSEYSFFWHAEFDKDFLVEEVIGGKEKDAEYPCLLHKFTL